MVVTILLFVGFVGASTNFTIVNGQIYTPGLAIVDSPQPYTPEGGDYLQVAIDVSGDGRLPWPPPSPDSVETGLLNITMFLFSYAADRNLTISNGTSEGWSNSTEAPEFFCNTTTRSFQNAGCQEIMDQESGSTVKHVNWVWPDCLVNDGSQSTLTSSAYNVSIHQSFRINNTGYYTIFNLPIRLTNTIPNDTQLSARHTRPLCALRENPLQDQTRQDASTSSPPSQPYLGQNVTVGGNNNQTEQSVAITHSLDTYIVTNVPMLLFLAFLSMVFL